MENPTIAKEGDIYNREAIKTNVLSLPNDLVINILASLSKSSHSDLLSAKSVCKALKELSDNDFIYQIMSLKGIELVPWNKDKQQVLLLERCIQCHNSEAFYRQGMVDYFSDKGTQYGLEYLQKAANYGHLGALYVTGIISLFGDNESNKKGIEILNQNVLKGILWKCRKEMILFIFRLWTNIPSIMNKVVVCCLNHEYTYQKKWRFTWPVDDGDDNVECKACKCDRELDYLMPSLGIDR
ncbi:putative F-box protein At1g67623 [Impatiens glandulifera]|uniref:putative F-box protein At1g67623 n=1 Tax=Impatiens glandulifera TaxID=253017 RepID=UPI001FB176D9|nr:putative F-box protein At1g67623 [Impatiens glandulifera]